MTINYEEFEEKYLPKLNHIEEFASFDGYMYETFGKELDYILTVDKENIWTIVDGDNDDLVIIPGYHLVNRFGYIITENKHNFEELTIIDL